MREKEFRLRDRHNKIVGYEKWYVGKFRKDEGKGFSPDSGYYEASPCWLYSTDGEKWNPTYIDHRFKDQFIELKDKKNVKIYLTDFCKCAHPNYTHFVEGEIVFDIERSIYALKTMSDGEIPLYEFDEIKVLGNRYEDSKFEF